MYYITGRDASIYIYQLLCKTHQCFCDLTPVKFKIPNDLENGNSQPRPANMLKSHCLLNQFSSFDWLMP